MGFCEYLRFLCRSHEVYNSAQFNLRSPHDDSTQFNLHDLHTLLKRKCEQERELRFCGIFGYFQMQYTTLFCVLLNLHFLKPNLLSTMWGPALTRFKVGYLLIELHARDLSE